MEKVFFISGLGADERLFKNLDMQGFDVIHVHFIEPDVRDTLTAYAGKLVKKYEIGANSNVIGVSLGGMLTIEIAKQVPLNKAIIISSIKSEREAPAYFAFFRALPVYKLVPGKWMVSAGFLFKPFFFKQLGGESRLFNLMLKNTSPRFLKWGLGAVLNWKPSPVGQHIHHLIGDADLVFNYRRIKDATVIKGGDHMMVFTRPIEVSRFVRGVLLG